MSYPTKVIFLGTPQSVTPIFETLIKQNWLTITTCITQPDKPIGRKKILTPSPIKLLASKHSIPTFTPNKLNQEFAQELQILQRPDIAILAAYGKIIPQWLLDWPIHGILNIHPSLLPSYRGATPGLGPIIRGELSTGVSYMHMDQQLDHGPIIAQFQETIRPFENREELTDRLLTIAAEYLPIVTKHTLNQPVDSPKEITLFKPFQEQNHHQASFCPILNKDDGYIPLQLLQAAINGHAASLQDFPKRLQTLMQDIYHPHLASRFLIQTIRALQPWPGVWTIVNDKRIKIIRASLDNDKLILHTIQPEGKKEISWEQYCEHHPLE